MDQIGERSNGNGHQRGTVYLQGAREKKWYGKFRVYLKAPAVSGFGVGRRTVRTLGTNLTCPLQKGKGRVPSWRRLDWFVGRGDRECVERQDIEVILLAYAAIALEEGARKVVDCTRNRGSRDCAYTGNREVTWVCNKGSR